MAAPIIGAGIGAVTSLAMGRDPLQGALLGGIGGGVFGGAGGLGSGFTEMGGLFGSAVPSAAGTVATSTPTLGGLALGGATTGAVGGATAGGVAGATASPYAFGNNALEVTGNTMNPALVGSSAGGQIPFTGLDKAINAITPSGGYDPSGGNFLSNMVKQDPVGTAFLGTSAAQNLLNPSSAGIQPTQLGQIKKGATMSTDGKPLNVLSPADYTEGVTTYPLGDDLAANQIDVTGSTYSVFPERLKGFGGYGMFYR